MLRFLRLAEVVVYALIGIAFLLGAIAMLVYTVVSFLDTYESNGFPLAIVTLINDLLLIMIIMEVLRTIVSYLEEKGTSLRPFLFIAAISATRRVLAVGAQMTITGESLTPEKFQEATIELGVNATAILVIALALFLLDRYGRGQPARTIRRVPMRGTFISDRGAEG
jgi:uncharacterized membrane protein (DUF373 family)